MTAPTASGIAAAADAESSGLSGPARVAARERRIPRWLALPLLFNAWTLRHLLRVVSWPNDAPFHHAMVDWATRQFQAGRVPLDGWFPRLSGGLPQFHSYQSLPHVVTGFLGVGIGAERAFALVTFVLLVTWPISVYICARAFGLSQRASVIAAAVAPLVHSPTGYGFETFSYVWTGNGLWSQLWGMWAVPLALAWSARAVRTGRGFGRSVAMNALTVAFHLPMAWFALLSLGLWPLSRPAQWRRTLPRTLLIGTLTLVASAWLLLPFLADRWATNASSFNGGDHFTNSFGWRRVGGWLLAGDLIDAGRLPLLSAVAFVGIATCFASWRRADRPWSRELLLLLVASGVLFVGRNPFGPLIDVLPGSSEVFLHRYHSVVQLALVLLVGVGCESLVRLARKLAPANLPALARLAVAVVAIVALTLPGMRQAWRFTDEDRRWVESQEQADGVIGRDFAALVSIAEDRADGRVYAGRINNWGKEFRIGTVPAPILLAHYPVDSIGFNLRVASLSADLETYLDDGNGADLAQMGIRYVILPRRQPPPSGAFFLTNRGDLQLWEIPAARLLRVVNSVGPVVEVDRGHLAERLLPAMRASEANPANAVAVDFEGRTAPPSSLDEADPEALAPGVISASDLDLDSGSVDATVDMEQAGSVLLAVNWHPRWRVTVDGQEVPSTMSAPTWLSVPVAAGHHQVSIRYRPYPYSWPLVLLALVAVALAALCSRRLRWGGGVDSGGPRSSVDGFESGARSDEGACENGHAGHGQAAEGTAGIGDVKGAQATAPADAGVASKRGGVRNRGLSAPLARVRASSQCGRSVAYRWHLCCLAGVVLLSAGCGTPHELIKPPTFASAPDGMLSDAARAAILRSPTVVIPLGQALAPDRPTVLLLVPPGCDSCAPAVSTLRNAAFGAEPFSVLVVGAPLPHPTVAETARIEGVGLYGLRPPDLAAISADFEIDEKRGAGVLLRPDGGVVRYFDSLDNPAEVVASATA